MTLQHRLWEELYAILHSLASGARYGFRIRLPHALIMTLLFNKPHVPVRAKVLGIVKVSMEHAGNLAAFAAVYKSILALLKWTHRYVVAMRASGPLSNAGTDVTEGLFRWLGRVLLTTFGMVCVACHCRTCVSLSQSICRSINQSDRLNVVVPL